MSNPKRLPRKKQVNPQIDRSAHRPLSPGKAYGIPKDEKGLLPWEHVAERMTQAHQYWVCTVSSDGRPHATPVDGIWLDDRLYFGGSPDTRRQRNLKANPAVCIHLESGTDVIIMHGEAHPFRAADRSMALRLSEASSRKYGYGPKPEEYESTTSLYVFQPQVVFAWKAFPKDVTRWNF